jgi:hypothetical protein
MINVSEHLQSIRWPDAVLIELVVSYDDVTLNFRESSGRRVAIVAQGHIGVNLAGLWDEVVVDGVELVEAHPFAEECISSVIERLGSLDTPTGSPRRRTKSFSTLVVSLTDGVELLCVAGNFVVEVSPQ